MVLRTTIKENENDPISGLINELKRLPGIGGKTATRLVYALIKKSREEIDSLVHALIRLKEEIRLCSICYNLSNSDPCRICLDSTRSENLLCVVEDPSHINAIEHTGSFKGRYHVLHGTISPLDGIGPEELKIKELLNRVEENGVKEVIVATNPTLSGDSTAMYISSILKKRNIRVTRIGFGVPVGGDLDYIDPVTITKAIENRKEV
jgi:recombination protein RecR